MSKNTLLLTGKGASPGKTMGNVAIINNFRDVSKMRQGNILVTIMTSPPWLPIMLKASAVITEQGGTLSHPAIVCREFGIPAIVAAEDATKKLKDGSKIFVDGSTGEVHESK